MNSHVGTPKCILEKFATGKSVCVFNLEKNKEYAQSVDTAGTEHNYYDEETEKLLSDNAESGFGALMKKLYKLKTYKEKTKILYENTKIIESYMVYQLQRSKKSLEDFNEHSLTALVYGPLTHSEYLKLISQVDPSKINILIYLKQPMSIRIALNNGETDFIDNSIGFYYSFNKETKQIDNFFIPISNREVITINSYDKKNEKTSYYYVDEERVNIMNSYCIVLEKAYGNGFIYSKYFVGEKYELFKQ